MSQVRMSNGEAADNYIKPFADHFPFVTGKNKTHIDFQLSDSTNKITNQLTEVSSKEHI